eukprot:467931-Prymnesium_polylepis.1
MRLSLSVTTPPDMYMAPPKDAPEESAIVLLPSTVKVPPQMLAAAPWNNSAQDWLIVLPSCTAPTVSDRVDDRATTKYHAAKHYGQRCTVLLRNGIDNRGCDQRHTAARIVYRAALAIGCAIRDPGVGRAPDSTGYVTSTAKSVAVPIQYNCAIAASRETAAH